MKRLHAEQVSKQWILDHATTLQLSPQLSSLILNIPPRRIYVLRTRLREILGAKNPPVSMEYSYRRSKVYKEAEKAASRSRQPWSKEHTKKVLTSTLSDAELARKLHRSIHAIEMRRYVATHK